MDMFIMGLKGCSNQFRIVLDKPITYELIKHIAIQFNPMEENAPPFGVKGFHAWAKWKNNYVLITQLMIECQPLDFWEESPEALMNVYVALREWDSDLDRKAPGSLRILYMHTTPESVETAAFDHIQEEPTDVHICKIPLYEDLDEINWEKYIVETIKAEQ